MLAQPENPFRLPNTTQRSVVIGRTGSGKTTLGFWLLSLAPFDRQPYVVIDYKGEDLFHSTDRIIQIGLNEVPKHPGLYRLEPRVDDEEGVEQWLWKVWQKENTGIVVDEAYRLPKIRNGAFDALLTQGRSKHIPIFAFTQRPSWVSQFIFSEADFFAVMQLNKEDDKKRVQTFIPRGKIDLEQRLPDYHAHWYDTIRDNSFILQPVEPAAVLSERIHDRLKPRRRLI